MSFTNEELADMKSRYQSVMAPKWRRETVYRAGAVVEHDGRQWERVFEGISYTPPPECTSAWKPVDE